jgi:diacylglycerol kinase (ATP)
MMLDLYLPIEEGRTRRRVGPRRPTSIGGASANGAGDRLAKTAPFSLDRRAQSFRFAWRGLVAVARTQHNAWIHGGATVAILAAGLALRLNVGEWAPLVLAMAAVWAAEAFNTAIEVLGDAVAADDHPLVGRAKDVAAGGVLVAAVGAVAVGLLVLVPRALEALGRS